MKRNNYDPVAKLYDRLTYLFFGNTQRRVQTALLKDIPANSRILIAGGGTGWILEELTKRHASGLDITYVELSQNMIALSRKRNIRQNVVHFINAPIEGYKARDAFDVVLTAFLFDNFSEEHSKDVVAQIDGWLRPGGLWLLADFDAEQASHHVWQRAMLSAMYLFFRLVCKIEARHLVRLKPLLDNAGYTKRHYAEAYGKFIFSAVYEKQAKNTNKEGN